ncbi:hypothetical protein [Dictyoglomus turgidum]|uniref:hypothetical protein n=1 Tax=Dictyoglomus turgidum TaxID=513050 RepID=UPI002355F7CA|nr:hypothetical protein [Dictyoglomus turgidum]
MPYYYNIRKFQGEGGKFYEEVYCFNAYYFFCFFVSGCVKQEPQADKDLSSTELNNIYDLVNSGEYNKSIQIYMLDLPGNLWPTSPVSKPELSKLIEKAPMAKSIDKVSIELNWQGPDADGWYTLTLDSSSYLKIRYYSSLKKLEFKAYLDSTDTLGFVVVEEGYFVFNKNIRVDTTNVYPVSGKFSFYFLAPSKNDPNKMNKSGLTLSWDDISITSLSQFNIGILTGSMGLYMTYVDYDQNINVNNKLMANFTSSVNGADTTDPILIISGTKDSDGDPTTDGYDNFDLELPLANLLGT